MRSREAIFIFLSIIIFTSVYVVYQNVLTKSVGFNGDQSKISYDVATSSFDFNEPNTFEEMKSDLQTVGCDIIITFPGTWSGIRGLSYNDALKLATKANFVGLAKDQSIGFIFYLDGTWWIWLKSSQEYTQFEKIEIQSVQCVKNTGYWTITMKLKNSGTAASTLIGVFINEVEVNAYGATTANAGQTATSMLSSQTIISGATATIQVYISTSWQTVSSGTTVNIKIHSAGGMDYVKLVELV